MLARLTDTRRSRSQHVAAAHAVVQRTGGFCKSHWLERRRRPTAHGPSVRVCHPRTARFCGAAKCNPWLRGQRREPGRTSPGIWPGPNPHPRDVTVCQAQAMPIAMRPVGVTLNGGAAPRNHPSGSPRRPRSADGMVRNGGHTGARFVEIRFVAAPTPKKLPASLQAVKLFGCGGAQTNPSAPS
jgi:hypothetical protein